VSFWENSVVLILQKFNTYFELSDLKSFKFNVDKCSSLHVVLRICGRSLPLSLVWLCKLLTCTQNYTEKKFELKATAITTLTHNVLGLEKQSQCSLNKQETQNPHNLSTHALFSGTKVCSSTTGPPGWPWLSVSPLCSNFNVLLWVEARGDTEQRVTEITDPRYKKIYLDLCLHSSDSSHQQDTKPKRLNYRTVVWVEEMCMWRGRDTQQWTAECKTVIKVNIGTNFSK